MGQFGEHADVRAVDLRDARVVERGQRPRLALESLSPVRVAGEGIGQDFQRNVTIQLRIAGAIHLAHSASTDFRGDFVWTAAHAGG